MKEKVNRRLYALLFVVLVPVLGYYSLQGRSEASKEKATSGLEDISASIKKRKSVPKADRPDLAYLQDFERTKNPNTGTISAQVLFDAQMKARSGLRKKAKISGVRWTHRGPNNIGGRTRALMFDPNDSKKKKVWAGGVSGGLWYNEDITDANSEWQLVDDFWANIAISDIAYDPSNTQVFYVSTGEGRLNVDAVRGAGIWKTTDGGATWSQLSSTAPSGAQEDYFSGVNAMRVNASGDIFAGVAGKYSNYGTVLRSKDGGSSWEKVLDTHNGVGVTANTEISAWASDLEIAENGDIYVGVGSYSDGGKIYRSVDNGDTWTDISPNDGGNRVELAIAPSASSATGSTVVYAVASNTSGSTDVEWIKKSTDGGDNWTDLDIPLLIDASCNETTSHFTRSQAWYNLILQVHPENENFVLMGGISLHRSIDGGTNWEAISVNSSSASCKSYVHSDQHAIVFRPSYTNEAIFGNDGGVYYSGNVGDPSRPEFEMRNNHYAVTQFYTIDIPNDASSNFLIGGTQDNGTLTVDRLGNGPAEKPISGDGGFTFVDKDNTNIVIGSYTENNFYLSTDGGTNFSQFVDDDNTGSFINPADYDSDNNVLYTNAYNSSNEAQILRVTDIGSSNTIAYLKQTSPENIEFTHVRVSPHTSGVLFLGGSNANVYKLSSANTTSDLDALTDLDPNTQLPTSGSVSCIEVGADDDHLLVTYSNYGVTSVWETKDGGTSWTNKEGNLPDMPVRWALYNPNNRNQVLLATETGVWSCSDISVSSPAWEATNTGLANVRCDMMRLREADNLVAIGTHGRGFYTTDIFVSTLSADFGIEKELVYQGEEVRFYDGSIKATSWSWDFGDGSGSSTDTNPTYTFNSSGVFTVTLDVSDGASGTDQKQHEIHVLPKLSTPYAAADGGDFESNPNHFGSAVVTGSLNPWERGVPTNTLSTVSSGTNAWKTDLDADVTKDGYSCALYTPTFDFSDETTGYLLKFDLGMDIYFSNSPYVLQLEYSLDRGETWQLLGDYDDARATNWYNISAENTSHGVLQGEPRWFDEITGALQESTYDVSTFAGQSEVAFRFLFTVDGRWTSTGYVDGVIIDDFEIEEITRNPNFIADYKTIIQGESVSFMDISSSSATDWEWNFGDGTKAYVANPKHVYATTGLKEVSLKLNNNDALVETKTDYIKVLAAPALPYSHSFDTDNAGFRSYNLEEEDYNWEWNSVDERWETVLGASHGFSTEYVLETPVFDFEKYSPTEISFYMHAFFGTGAGFNVQYTTDGGTSWAVLGDENSSNWYTDASVTALEGANGVAGAQPGFGTDQASSVNMKHDISTLAGQSSVRFRFVFASASSANYGAYIYNLDISGTENTNTAGTWTGATSSDWFTAANWFGGAVPGEGVNVSIPSGGNQPVIGGDGNAVCGKLTIVNGASLTIAAGSSLEAKGATLNEGTFTIKASATEMGSFLDNGQIGGDGTFTIEAYTKANEYKSFANPTRNTLPAVTGAYVQTHVESSNTWENLTPTSGGLEIGKGYLVGYSGSDQTYSLSGTFHTGNLYHTMPFENQGWFFAGNPYTSYIDWNESASGAWVRDDVNLGIHIWNGTNYGAYMLNATLGTNGASNIIAPTQGFFVRNRLHNNDFHFNNAIRIAHEGAKKKRDMLNVMRLRVAGTHSDEMVLEFKPHGKDGFDAYDHEKAFSWIDGVPAVFFEVENKKLDINTMQNLTEGLVLPFSFQKGFDEPYAIEAEYVLSFSDWFVYLYDSETNAYVNLKETPQYTFSPSENDETRFSLMFSKKALGIESALAKLKIFVRSNNVFVQNMSGNTIDGKIEVFTLTGQQVYSAPCSGKSLYRFPLNEKQGIYLARWNSDGKIKTERIVLE